MSLETLEYINEAKENQNVFHYGYYSWRYPSCWFRNIKQFFRNIKYGWQRAVKGYCDIDVFNLDSHILDLLICELDEFIKINIGYPHELTPEEWENILRTIQNHFANAQRFIDDDPDNEYEKLKQKYLTRTKNKDGSITVELDENEYSLELMNKFRKRLEDITQYQNDEYTKGMDMLTKWLRHMWC